MHNQIKAISIANNSRLDFRSKYQQLFALYMSEEKTFDEAFSIILKSFPKVHEGFLAEFESGNGAPAAVEKENEKQVADPVQADKIYPEQVERILNKKASYTEKFWALVDFYRYERGCKDKASAARQVMRAHSDIHRAFIRESNEGR